jgi:hypothetical protein
MNPSAVRRLAGKDCSLMRRPLAAYVAAALVSLALAAAGGGVGRSAAATLAMNVLIGVSFHVMLGPVLGERPRRTLGFVMSLPVTPADVALSKIFSAYLLFLPPGTIAATALIWLTPFHIPRLMAASHAPWWTHFPGTLAWYGLVLGAWLLLFTVVLGAAVVTESIGWTIGVMSGLVFVVGNFLLQALPRLAGAGRYLRALGRGQAALPLTIAVEWALLAALVAATVALARRKTSFV